MCEEETKCVFLLRVERSGIPDAAGGCRRQPQEPNKKRPLRVFFCLARLKEFESPTFRLGGGRSILLSYKRGYKNIIIDYIFKAL